MHKLLLLFIFLFFINHFGLAQISKSNPTDKKQNKTTKQSKSKTTTAGYKDKKKSRKKKKEKGEKEEMALELKKKMPMYHQPTALIYRPIIRNGKKLTGTITTRQGFRICIYDGGNREDAFAVKQKFMRDNLKTRSYIVYNRPYYKIKVGDFENKKIAQKELKTIVEQFPHAFITPDIVTVKDLDINRFTQSN
jgi:hypothetical protein